MKLSQAILVSLCCLGVGGCANFAPQPNSCAPAPAPIASLAGPEDFAAPPPPPVAPSTISVAPGKMYNMNSKGKSTSSAKSKKTSTRSVSSEETPSGRTSEKESSDAGASSGAAASADASSAPADSGDATMMARPVRKSTARKAAKKTESGSDTESGSTYRSGTAPQSSIHPKGKGSVAKTIRSNEVEVLPVSNPAPSKKVDSKLSS